MFFNKAPDGTNNLSSKIIQEMRCKNGFSQRVLADKMTFHGITMDKNAIQRIEAGKRFVTDIELIAFMEVLNFTIEDLWDTLENK